MKPLDRTALRKIAATDQGAEYLLRRLPGGIVSELIVLERMTSIGLVAGAANLNQRERDLIATRPDGSVIHVEVKSISTANGTFWVPRCPDPMASDFWVFVNGFGECRVLRVEEAIAVWRSNPHNIDIEAGTARTKSGNIRVGDIRWHQLRDLQPGWEKLIA